jgi:single-strand DNA-binding protein
MLNEVKLIGNIGSEIEVKTFENGDKIANFSLATSKNYKDKDGVKQSIVQWHNIKALGFNAEFAEKYLEKGRQIFIHGEIQYRSYENKEGNKVYITEIVVDKHKGVLLALGKKADQDQAPAPEDDLPY